ncbi:hypothetical protein [Bradyrhizobium sp. CB1015]|nr:hypothetical protein [Bradyrhizobium sp. CB1015]UWU91480.1 hypothetical protein N2604_34450 [Bradyrhizobium sp. CB1015]
MDEKKLNAVFGLIDRLSAKRTAVGQDFLPRLLVHSAFDQGIPASALRL